MKLIVSILTFCLVGVHCLPQPLTINDGKVVEEPTRIIASIIEGVIQGLAQTIRDEGYDPFELDDLEENLVVLEVAHLTIRLNQLVASGVSNIVTNEVVETSGVLRLDISLPEFKIELGNIDASIDILNGYLVLTLGGSGTISVSNINIVAEVVVDLTGGIGLEFLNLELNIGNAQSNVVTIINDVDISDIMNEFINETSLQLFRAYKDQIEELIIELIPILIDGILGA